MHRSEVIGRNVTVRRDYKELRNEREKSKRQIITKVVKNSHEIKGRTTGCSTDR